MSPPLDSMDTPWTALLGPTLWTIVQILRSMARQRQGPWAACETTEQELARLVGFATRKAVISALRQPLAPLFIRVRHRGERRQGRPVRLPSLYWVLAEDPPHEAAPAVLAGQDPSAVLSVLGLTPPAPPPGYRRRTRPRQSRQLPVVGVVRGAGRRPEMSPEGAFQEPAAVAAAAGKSPEMYPEGTFQGTRGPARPAAPASQEKSPEGTLRAASRKSTRRTRNVVVLLQDAKEQQQSVPEGDILGRLVAAGVHPGVAASLLAEPGGPERAARQLGWLSARNVRDPAGALVAAIREDWPPPAGAGDPQPEEPRPRPIERLRGLREEARREKVLAEQALAWLESQPVELRQRLEQAARRELGDGAVPVPRAALRAVLARLALEQMQGRGTVPPPPDVAAERGARRRPPARRRGPR